MAGMLFSRKAVVVTQRFAEGSFAAVVVAISLITAATLIYVWFIA